MPNTYIVSIGSNSNAEQNVTAVQILLNNAFTNVRFSNFQWIPAIGNHYTQPFYNGAVSFESSLTALELKPKLKAMEVILGRTPEQKAQGIVPMDLDIIVCNEEIIHPDYNRFPFVKNAVNALLKNDK
ncbi:2-amino-4-hydroxy-6-hydroxymethyldihydropteridine diphosphokinase [Paludibacter sp.]|uniref:2-amino-4-hydroxy-6- hydroxymethyldihydropteridine diphosphokinase n=1 Tax=Paludibacter sp. TaxID=1898105 RepID=UPI001355C0A8|nr:2-amino-4-hydroxy-6-hydroxymethyldihydropteridine diphosphokinase [Paludibacter sp.]MTK52999.1 2-amino-4-hydroxy-6-hydroxymethyldihydropteridine diphosphokinase [Paludibacter sp.]